MANRNVSVNLIGRDQLSREFGKASKSADRLKSTMASVGGAIAGALTIDSVISFTQDAIAEAREAIKVTKMTNSVIKSTGGAAKISAKQVGDLAEALSRKAGVDDEAIQSGANLLLTFKNVKNEAGAGNKIFSRATAAIVDMTAGMNRGEVTASGLKSSTIQLGKALNDPIKGMSALGRVGIQFTASQKKRIEGYVKEGNTLKAQKLILKEVESQFKGTAAAAADPMQKARVVWDNFKEAVGVRLMGVMNTLAGVLVGKVVPALSKAKGFIELVVAGFSGKGANVEGLSSRVSILAVTIGSKLRTAYDIAKSAASALFNAIRTGLGWLQQAVQWIRGTSLSAEYLRTIVVLLGGAFIVWKVATVTVFALQRGMLLLRGAVLAVQAGVWLLNGALAANPIGIIVVAVAALIAGLILLFKHNATFRNVVLAAWNAIKTAAMTVWNSFLKPIFLGIKSFITAHVIPAFKMMWLGAQIVWNGIKAAFMAAWPTIQVIFGFIKFWIMNVIVPQFKFLWAVIKIVWAGIVGAIKVAWAIIKGVWMMIKANLMVLKFAFMVIVAAIKTNWKIMATIIKAIWNNILKPVWNAIKNALSGPLSAAFNAFKKVATAVWNGVKSVIMAVWNGGIKPAFNKIKEGVAAVQKAFRTATTAIGRIWNEIRSKTKAPVSFVVNTVYNKGIRRVWNFVAGLAGMGKLGEVKGFAKGGILPGYSRKDDRLIMARSGEGILTPEAVQGLGPRFVERANSAGRNAAKALSLGGDPKSGFGIPGFASGGIIGALKGAASRGVDFFKNAPKMLASKGITAWASSILNPMKRGGGGPGNWGKAISSMPAKMIGGFVGWIKKKIEPLFSGGPGVAGALQWAKTQRGKPYVWGGVGPRGYDCSGFMSAITNKIKGKPIHRRLFTTHSFNGRTGPGGFQRNFKSGFQVGVTNAGVGHMAGTLGGTAVESSGSAGVRVGGGARGATNGLFGARYGLRADTGNLALNPGWNPPVYNGTGRMEVLETSIGSKGSNTYNINVNVAPGANPAETGRRVVDAIRAYETKNGKGWRR